MAYIWAINWQDYKGKTGTCSGVFSDGFVMTKEYATKFAVQSCDPPGGFVIDFYREPTRIDSHFCIDLI